MFKTMRAIICAAEVNALVNDYIKGEPKTVLYLRGNSLKSKYAKMVLADKIDIEVYEKMFRIKETDMQTHFLDLWVKETLETQAEA